MPLTDKTNEIETTQRSHMHADVYPIINHHILLEKLTNSGLPRHIVRWIGAFLLDRRQKVMIGSNCSRSGSPNGGVPQGTLSGPEMFFIVR